MSTTELDRLRSIRASLEALAEVTMTMEEDFKTIAAEYDAATTVCSSWMESILKSRDELSSSSSATAEADAAFPAPSPMRVCLASKSKNRRALIGSALPPNGFELSRLVLNPEIDERAPELRPEGISAEELVLRIANAKADRAIELLKSESEKVDILVCADQVVKFAAGGVESDVEIREKPRDSEEAISHLMSYGQLGKPAICVTGVVVVSLKTGRRFEGVDVASQEIRPMTREEARVIYLTGDVSDSAGSFSVESRAMKSFIGKTVGELESVQGMPLRLTRKLIVSAGKASLLTSSMMGEEERVIVKRRREGV